MKIYTDGQGNQFKINVVDVDVGGWVHYERLSDNKEFSCLLEAFHARFTELDIAR